MTFDPIPGFEDDEALKGGMPGGKANGGAGKGEWSGGFAGYAGAQGGARQENSDWPEPEPLGEEMPPVEPFDPRLLPRALRSWAVDAAERMQAPTEYIATALIVGAGALIGKKVGIRPKRHDDWLVVPNLWGAIVGRPSQLKTPAMREGLGPLHRLEREAAARHEEELRLAEVEKTITQAQKRDVEKDIATRLKKGATREALVADLLALAPPALPTRQRFIVNDSTVEKLGELLRDNPNGLLLVRDELTGWLRTLERDGRENDRSFYLEAWNGNGSYTCDRVERGTVEIEHAIMSIFGGIQPGPLLTYLGAIRKGGIGDDGLLQRFQILVWPDPRRSWEDVDRKPDAGAWAKVWESFERLAGLTPEAFGAETPPGRGIPFVRFDEAAQVSFVEWRAGLEARLLSGDLPPAFESHLAKFRSLVPSLALIFQAIEVGKGPVGLEACVRGLAWADYLEGHARRVYHALFRGEHVVAQALGTKLKAGALADGFSLRDVHERDWAMLTEHGPLQAALDLLEERGWLRSRQVGTGGRPKRVYDINPGLGGDGR